MACLSRCFIAAFVQFRSGVPAIHRVVLEDSGLDQIRILSTLQTQTGFQCDRFLELRDKSLFSPAWRNRRWRLCSSSTMRLKIISHAPKSDSSQVTNLCVTRQDIQSVFVPGGDPTRDLPTVSIDHSRRTGLTFTVRALSPACLPACLSDRCPRS